MTDRPPSPTSTPKSDWIRPVIFIVLMLPLLAGGVLLGLFFNMRTLEKNRAPALPKTPAEISLQAENILLKKMLGQVEGQVAVLGPIKDGGSARGKIVWDEALQQGFLFIARLPEPVPIDKAVFVWAEVEGGALLPCARFQPSPAGDIRRAFTPPNRVLKAKKFLVSVGEAQGMKNPREKLIAEGELDPR